MELATNLEQIGEILGYVISDIDRGYISRYSRYLIAVGAGLVLVFIISRVIARLRAVAEYIDDGVALMFIGKQEFERQKMIEEIVSDLYEHSYNEFGRKQYFSLELAIGKQTDRFVIYLPRKLYDIWKFQSETYGAKVVTREREKFIQNMGSSKFSTKVELGRDFIFPLKLTCTNRMIEYLREQETLFFQIVCRPQGDKWKKKLGAEIERLKRGGAGRVGRYLSPFWKISLGFLNIFGNIITKIVHGSTSSKVTKSKEVDEKTQKLLEVLEAKQSKVGCETQIRLVIEGENEERTYFLFEKFMDIFSSSETENNFLVFDKVKSKLPNSLKNELILANIDKSTVDILNEKEISKVFHCLC